MHTLVDSGFTESEPMQIYNNGLYLIYSQPITCANSTGCTVNAQMTAKVQDETGLTINYDLINFDIDGTVLLPADSEVGFSPFQLLSHHADAVLSIPHGNHTLNAKIYFAGPTNFYSYMIQYHIYKP